MGGKYLINGLKPLFSYNITLSGTFLTILSRKWLSFRALRHSLSPHVGKNSLSKLFLYVSRRGSRVLLTDDVRAGVGATPAVN